MIVHFLLFALVSIVWPSLYSLLTSCCGHLLWQEVPAQEEGKRISRCGIVSFDLVSFLFGCNLGSFGYSRDSIYCKRPPKRLGRKVNPGAQSLKRGRARALSICYSCQSPQAITRLFSNYFGIALIYPMLEPCLIYCCIMYQLTFRFSLLCSLTPISFSTVTAGIYTGYLLEMDKKKISSCTCSELTVQLYRTGLEVNMGTTANDIMQNALPVYILYIHLKANGLC